MHFLYNFNPILHTAMLENRTLTLKKNPEKYYFCKKSSVLNPGKFRSIVQRHFTFNAINVFKYILMYGKLTMTCFNKRCTCMV
jgi:hypothetical protein